jgi:hypothetical protein
MAVGPIYKIAFDELQVKLNARADAQSVGAACDDLERVIIFLGVRCSETIISDPSHRRALQPPSIITFVPYVFEIPRHTIYDWIGPSSGHVDSDVFHTRACSMLP